MNFDIKTLKDVAPTVAAMAIGALAYKNVTECKKKITNIEKVLQMKIIPTIENMNKRIRSLESSTTKPAQASVMIPNNMINKPHEKDKAVVNDFPAIGTIDDEFSDLDI